jgi:hypothetical protein
MELIALVRAGILSRIKPMMLFWMCSEDNSSMIRVAQ